jgi:hypothetical protein
MIQRSEQQIDQVRFTSPTRAALVEELGKLCTVDGAQLSCTATTVSIRLCARE